MQCRACGTILPQGVRNCPTCGAQVPLYGGANSPSPYDPTVWPSPPGSAAGPQGNAAPPPPPSYGTPGPQYPASPPPSYGAPGPQYPAAPPSYGVPGSQYPASPPPSYGAPGSQYPASPPYGVPGPQYPAYPQVPGQPMPPAGQPPRKRRTGLIIGIIVGVLVLSCAVCSLMSSPLLKNANSDSTTGAATSTTTPGTVQATRKQVPTPVSTINDVATVAIVPTTQPGGANQPVTPTTQPGGANPSVSPAAAAIITGVTTARSVNQTTAQPINPATTFQLNAPIYVTFTLDSQHHDFTREPGYVQAQFYAGSRLLINRSLAVNRSAPGGYFAVTYSIAATGYAKLYWCTQATCSDGQLAQVATFTVGP